MNTEKMYNPVQFCCICMNKSGLKHLFEVDSDGVSHYNKLTSSIAEMNFKEMNDQRLICAECCVTLNTVYDFRQLCLRSKINLISQLQKSDHSSGTVRVCLKDIKPELIVEEPEKNRRVDEKEGSNSLERSKPQITLQTESSKENTGFSVSIKKECESDDEDSSVHEVATVDHVDEITHIDVKVEDVEPQTKMENDSEYYVEFSKIEIEQDPLAVVKEEPMSDTETQQDGSTSEADAGTSEDPKGSEESMSYECEICKKGYTDKDDLIAHMKTHSSDRPFKCDICYKGFNYKRYFTSHMKTHFSEGQFECEICSKSFKQKEYLIAHMKTHSSDRPHECEICNKDFKVKSSLSAHMKTHSSVTPYKCKICDRGFNHKKYYTYHMKTHSSGANACKICKKEFYNRWHFTEHKKTHSSEKPYECEICKKGFNHKWSLTVHMQTHSSERPYECELCNKGFKLKSSLSSHMKIHSNETPYKCQICKKAFKHRSSLNAHMKTH